MVRLNKMFGISSLAFALVFTLVLGCSFRANANVSLPRVFSDGMVLQREMPVTIWGWADDGEKVTVSLAGRKKATVAKDGAWSVQLTPLPAGGPHVLEVAGTNRVEIKDVMVGEVWLCSGQSNMVWELKKTTGGMEEADRADDALLRVFTVPRCSSATEASDFPEGKWEQSNKGKPGDFSAVAYYLGKNLREELKVPVGIVVSAWGGTRAESWMARPAVDAWEIAQFGEEEYKKRQRERKEEVEHYYEYRAAWKKAGKPAEAFVDTGASPETRAWISGETMGDAWSELELPSTIDRIVPGQLLNGEVWFRKEVELPKDWSGKDLVLSLGRVDDFDTVWVNGTRVGYTGQETEKWWMHPREYTVPSEVLQPGKNAITIRVWDQFRGGGFFSGGGALSIGPAGEAGLALAGPWHYRLGRTEVEMPTVPRNLRAKLFNGLIAPILPMQFRGIAWYQGEANTDSPEDYGTLLPALIENWRTRFNRPTMPFYIIQLANYIGMGNDTTGVSWAVLREKQFQTAAQDKNSHLVVTIDLGETHNIHPKNKKDVGYRLSRIVLAETYGKKTACRGPVIKGVSVSKNALRLTFDYDDSGLIAKGDGGVTGFEVAGPDGVYVKAQAAIKGHQVEVSSPDVATPVKVRYAWKNDPACNLYNKNGFPAVPFQATVGE